MTETWRILTHGGAGSDPDTSDGTQAAARRARDALAEGADPLDAACAAVVHLEDDPRFNAGHGSYHRDDGVTVEMDAACACSRGRFGAVACIQEVANPVQAARHVVDTENVLLAGEGARRFALDRGLPTVAAAELAGREPADAADGQSSDRHDTVGCVLWDGEVFAAALSSGGTRKARVGRVGDVPLPGCGLRAGPAGALAATGHGETIALQRSADRGYAMLDAGKPAGAVAEALVAAIPEERSFGVIVVGPDGDAVDANRTMAWNRLTSPGQP